MTVQCSKVPGKLLVICGPTAAGKTEYALRLAEQWGVPILNADSRQIYRDLPIGTAAPTAEEQQRAKHYFVGTHGLHESYNAGAFERDVLEVVGRLIAERDINQVDAERPIAILAGGSMLYIEAVCKGLDDLPDGEPGLRKELWNRLAEEGVDVLAEELRLKDPLTYSRIDVKNSQRVIRALEVCILTGKPFSSYKTGVLRTRPFIIEKVGLQRPREELYSRINRRVLDMIDAGLEDEVRTLIPYRDCQALQTVGYKEMFKYIDGECSLDEAVRMIQLNTRHYAKRQLTWWRRDPDIRWIDL